MDQSRTNSRGIIDYDWSISYGLELTTPIVDPALTNQNIPMSVILLTQNPNLYRTIHQLLIKFYINIFKSSAYIYIYIYTAD